MWWFLLITVVLFIVEFLYKSRNKRADTQELDRIHTLWESKRE